MNTAKRAEAKAVAKHQRSPFPRSPRHGKHARVQGDPNTRSFGK